MADICGPNDKIVENIQMHRSVQFCVDLIYGVGVIAFYA